RCAAHLAGAAVSEFHHPLRRWHWRHPAGYADGACPGDARAVRWRDVHRPGGFAADRADDSALMPRWKIAARVFHPTVARLSSLTIDPGARPEQRQQHAAGQHAERHAERQQRRYLDEAMQEDLAADEDQHD